jgi:hypothetical protein
VIDRDHDEPRVGQVFAEAVSGMAVDIEVPVLLVVRASGPDPTASVTSNVNESRMR